ncbi:MAG: MobF family relaxase [Ilumatobacteraceae bacterium]
MGTRRMATGGLVAPQFRHRSSRAGDPHLHWHVLVANMAQGIDGRWSALDGTAIYAAKRTARVLFQTALRKELGERLGVVWGPVRNDSAEIAGVPRRVLREFSQRREQMEEWLQANGRSGPAAADEAMLTTRMAKPDTTFEALTIEWHQRAVAAGFGPHDLDALLTGHSRGRERAPGESQHDASSDRDASPLETNAVGFDDWLDQLLEQRLTANESTFDRFALAQAVAAAMPPGTSIEHVEQTVDRCLASPLVVPINAARAPMHGPNGSVADDRARTYTSRRLLEIEARFLGQITGQRETTPLGASIVERSWRPARRSGSTKPTPCACCANPTPYRSWSAVPGPARPTPWAPYAPSTSTPDGTCSASPRRPRGPGTGDGAGITSRTIASFLRHPPRLTPTSVVVIDEAGMAGTRDLAGR